MLSSRPLKLLVCDNIKFVCGSSWLCRVLPGRCAGCHWWHILDHFSTRAGSLGTYKVGISNIGSITTTSMHTICYICTRMMIVSIMAISDLYKKSSITTTCHHYHLLQILAKGMFRQTRRSRYLEPTLSGYSPTATFHVVSLSERAQKIMNKLP